MAINNLPFSSDNGFVTTANVTTGNAQVSGNVTAGILLTDNYRWANGVPVDFGGGGGGSNYSNANVAAYLPINTSNVSGNNFSVTGNVVVGKTVYANIVGNVTTGNLTYTNTNVVIGVNASANLNGVSIGRNAGNTKQGLHAIAIGYNAGCATQGNTTIAIGAGAGNTGQKDGAIAIGETAGYKDQGNNTVAIGTGAGQTTQGGRSVAIGPGAGYLNQANNSIILNASNGTFTASSEGFFVKPIRNTSPALKWPLYLDIMTSEIIIDSASPGPYGNIDVANYLSNAYTGRLGVANTILIGQDTGSTGTGSTLGNNVIQIGYRAGWKGSTDYAIAIGYDCANSQGSANSQGFGAVAIGAFSGPGKLGAQGANAVAIGFGAGGRKVIDVFYDLAYQSPGAVAVGGNSGVGQKENAVAIGFEAAGTMRMDDYVLHGDGQQGPGAVALGYQAAYYDQFRYSVAVGTQAGYISQGWAGVTDTGPAVAVGYQAGYKRQAPRGTAIGTWAGCLDQADDAVAIGASAGYETQGQNAIAIGRHAGYTAQAARSIVINATGSNVQSVGEDTFVVKPVRINGGAGNVVLLYNNGTGEVTSYPSILQWQADANIVMPTYTGPLGSATSIQVGYLAGATGQRSQAIAIGSGAGQTNQGNNSVAIGAGAGSSNLPNNSIIINATGVALNGTNQGFYVAPVRNDTVNVTNAVYYNTTTKELTYGPGGSGGNYGNANVAAYLPTYTGNISAGNIRVTSNATANNLIATSNVSTGNLTATGNATAAFFIGDGSQLTGVYANANVANYLPIYTGNISAGNLRVIGNATTNNLVASSNVTTGNLTATSNVTAAFFIGDGSRLTNIPVANSIANGTSSVGFSGVNGNILLRVNGNNVGNLSANTAAIGPNISYSSANTPSIKMFAVGSNINSFGNNTISGNVSIFALGANIASESNVFLATNSTANINLAAVGSNISVKANSNSSVNLVALGYNISGNFINELSVARQLVALNATNTSLSPTGNGFFVDPVRNDTYNQQSVFYNPSTKEFTYASGAGPTIANGTSNVTVVTSGGNINFNVGGSLVGNIRSAAVALPVRYDASSLSNGLYYNSATKELTYGPSGTGTPTTTISNGTSNVVLPQTNGNVYFNVNGGIAGVFASNRISLGIDTGTTGFFVGPVQPIGDFVGRRGWSILQYEASSREVRYGALPAISNSSPGGSASVTTYCSDAVEAAPYVRFATDTGNMGLLSSTRISFGLSAGGTTNPTTTLGFSPISIGNAAAAGGGNDSWIAIGERAGAGTFAAGTGLRGRSIAIGDEAGRYNKGTATISIGAFAGVSTNNGSPTAGDYSIAIGSSAARSGIGTSSIIISATGSGLSNKIDNAFFVEPLRSVAPSGLRAMYYNASTKEVTYSTVVSSTPLTAEDAQLVPGEVGQTIHILPAGKPAYWDGVDNAWKYYSDDTAV